ncbi:hypothetical protein [Methylobrevis albus]|uniref:Uncharacterized protein n=1 Tax=Methylobrevis albus TaxID=2793297 RepID=A0A931MX49_9HYPH|nr:hypothetical protein [Methylobrevis albus]MBH0238463.1 hypothetical protein [Methylobrevis albus]
MTDHPISPIAAFPDDALPAAVARPRRRDSILLVVLLAVVTILTVAGVASAAPAGEPAWRLVEAATRGEHADDLRYARLAASDTTAVMVRPARDTLFEAAATARVETSYAYGVIGAMLAGMLGLSGALWREFGRRVTKETPRR